jgi:preprotein translocase subunit SecG
MQTVLIIIHMMVAISLIVVVLLQRSEGGGLGIGGSGSGLGGLFSPRGAASTLTRTTAILGIIFFSTSLALTLLSLGGRQPTSILNRPVPGAPAAAPGRQAPPTLPSAPAAPTAPPQLPTLPPAR